MSTPAEGRLFDGLSARPKSVLVTVGNGGLEIAAVMSGMDKAGETHFWPIADIRFVDSADRGDSQVFTNLRLPMSRLVMSSPDTAVRIGHALGVARHDEAHISHSTRALIAWGVIALLMGAAVLVGIPRLAAAMGPHLPYAWRHQLGRYVVEAITVTQETCSADAGRKALDRIVAQIMDVVGHDERVVVEVTDSDEVNAFAAPGGSIVLFNGLIQDAESAEELAGTIGHEIGHVVKEHPTGGVIRGLGLTLAANVMLGGSDGGVASAVAMIYSLSYDRKQEAAADDIAAELLVKMGINPAVQASFFERRNKTMGEKAAGAFNYLSTHPALPERIAAARALAAPRGERLVITAEEWRDLRAICKGGGG